MSSSMNSLMNLTKHLSLLTMGLVWSQLLLIFPAHAESPSWTVGVQMVVCHEASGDHIFPLSRFGHNEQEFETIPGSNWQAVLDGIFTRIAGLNPSRAKRYRDGFAELMTSSRFLSGVSLQFQDQPWPLEPLPKQCETRSIAVLRATALPLQPRLIVDNDFWSKLDDQSRAITFFELLFSEELWRKVDFYAHPGFGDPMRYVEAHYKKVWTMSTLVTSKEMSQQTQDSWLKLLKEVFYVGDGDWNGCRFPLVSYLYFQEPFNTWHTKFLDGPCPVLMQGKMIPASEVEVDANGRVESAIVTDAELSIRTGQKVAVSGWASLDQDGFLTEATLKGIQTFTLASGNQVQCQGLSKFDSKTGALLSCTTFLPLKIETPRQKIELSPDMTVDPSCSPAAGFIVGFLPNGDWSPIENGYISCRYVARGSFLISDQWVSGERSNGNDFRLSNFKLNQDVSYRIKGTDFTAKAGEKITVYFDESGHHFMGGKISQPITVDTSDGKHTLGTGKCHPNPKKTYDSTALFYPDGKLAMGVILGNSRFYMKPYFLDSGRFVEFHGTARVLLNPDGTLRDSFSNLCSEPSSN